VAWAKPDGIILAAATVGGILANDSYPADFLFDNLAIETKCHPRRASGQCRAAGLSGMKFAPQPIKEEALLTGPLEPTNEWYAIAKIAGRSAPTTVSNREIFRDFPDIDWVTGRTTVISEAGSMLYLSPIVPFPRKAIAAGIFDGRFRRPFIEQEATFWRPRLWQKAGGVDLNFRLAGDFDLWRRFARQTDLVNVDAILGCFRVRAGQLSEDMPGYRAELDASLSPTEIETRDKAAKRYARAGFDYRVLVRYYQGPWRVSVGRCASRRFSAPRPFARNIGA
jgi:hypothetical protein